MLDPFVYTEKTRVLAPEGFKNTALSLITIIALIMALLIQPLVGQWSDRTHSRWGKRIPYLTAGTIGLSFALVILITADTLWLLVLGAVLVSGFANTVQAVWQALIPDYVPHRQHGTAAGTKTILELIGVVAGIAVVGYFLSQGNLWGAPLIIIVVFFIILAITIVTIHKVPAASAPLTTKTSNNSFKLLFNSMKEAPTAFKWWMLNRFLFWSSAMAVRTFLLNFLEDVLGLAPTEAQALSSRLLIMLGIGVFLLALPAGYVADRIGRRPILIAAGLMAATGAGLFMVWRDLNLLFIAGGLIAAGAGIYASASWALATDLAPKDQGALYLALANAASVMGSIGGRLGGPLIDGLNNQLGTVDFGYVVNFGIAALFFAVSSLVVLKIPRHSKRAESQ